MAHGDPVLIGRLNNTDTPGRYLSFWQRTNNAWTQLPGITRLATSVNHHFAMLQNYVIIVGQYSGSGGTGVRPNDTNFILYTHKLDGDGSLTFENAFSFRLNRFSAGAIKDVATSGTEIHILTRGNTIDIYDFNGGQVRLKARGTRFIQSRDSADSLYVRDVQNATMFHTYSSFIANVVDFTTPAFNTNLDPNVKTSSPLTNMYSIWSAGDSFSQGAPVGDAKYWLWSPGNGDPVRFTDFPATNNLAGGYTFQYWEDVILFEQSPIPNDIKWSFSFDNTIEGITQLDGTPNPITHDWTFARAEAQVDGSALPVTFEWQTEASGISDEIANALGIAFSYNTPRVSADAHASGESRIVSHNWEVVKPEVATDLVIPFRITVEQPTPFARAQEGAEAVSWNVSIPDAEGQTITLEDGAAQTINFSIDVAQPEQITLAIGEADPITYEITTLEAEGDAEAMGTLSAISHNWIVSQPGVHLDSGAIDDIEFYYFVANPEGSGAAPGVDGRVGRQIFWNVRVRPPEARVRDFSLERIGTIEFNAAFMSQFPTVTGRKLIARVCVAGDGFIERGTGLYLDGRSAQGEWHPIDYLAGWQHSNDYYTLDYIHLFDGRVERCSADGGWIDWQVPIPDTVAELRLRPVYASEDISQSVIAIQKVTLR